MSVDEVIEMALAEDLADGPDVTSTATIPQGHRSQLDRRCVIARPGEHGGEVLDGALGRRRRITDLRGLAPLRFADPRIGAEKLGEALDRAQRIVELMAQPPHQRSSRQQTAGLG